jgi:hypothetical protein
MNRAPFLTAKPVTTHSTSSKPLQDKMTGKEKKAEPKAPKP